MPDVQAIVYKRILRRICIDKGSYMDQHNTPSSASQGIRRTNLQQREISDGGAESELTSTCLTAFFPYLLVNVTILKPSVKEVLTPISP